MLDYHLAELYGVETGALNRAVKRNRFRFPADFMFQLSLDEAVFDDLRAMREFQPPEEPPRPAIGFKPKDIK